MLGAIAGDIIGSVHEYSGIRRVDFPLFVLNSDYSETEDEFYTTRSIYFNADEFDVLYAWWPTVFPGMVLTAVVVVFNFLGDVLGERLGA
jgi:hypothetical protein